MKEINLINMDDDQRIKFLERHRINCLSRIIDKDFINNEQWMSSLDTTIEPFVYYELIKKLDETFNILKDGSKNPLLGELISKKVKKIIEIINNQKVDD